jgi:uncharacterized protein
MHSSMMARIRLVPVPVGLVAGGLVAAVVLAGCGSSPASSADRSTAQLEAAQIAGATCRSGAARLTVSGSGTASGPPDVLTVVVDVSVTDATAAAALADDNTRSASVISTLTHGGVASRQIQTSNVTLQPQYRLGNPSTIVAYQVTNTITAQLHDFSTAGTLIDDVVAAAGDAVRLDSVTFSLTNPDALEDQARAQAVHEARGHAQSMAQASGERLGPICSISDQSQPVSPPYLTEPAASDAGRAAQGVSLAAGTQQATAQVTMVYSLVPSSRSTHLSGSSLPSSSSHP